MSLNPVKLLVCRQPPVLERFLPALVLTKWSAEVGRSLDRERLRLDLLKGVVRLLDGWLLRPAGNLEEVVPR